ncbi:MAG: nitroreductase family deazaflavin-dependent oxidoreductase [Ilumatobacter sp.]|nr:nitroreductase family deazaflavin-dependent oxidoreductase [Ilumatobacter sp.]
MGVQAALGYEFRQPNAFQRANQKIASTKGGAWFFSKTVQTLDGAVHRLTRDRTSASEILAGLPVIRVTTTGRRSGQPRLAPLIAVPIGDDLALLGTNFGGTSTPAWVHNLVAEPRATAAYRDAEIDVVARPATAEEFEQVFTTGGGLYGGYEKYRERVTAREIKVFVLEEG